MGSEKKPTGRPSLYSEAIATELCERMAIGQSMRTICQDDHMPDRSTVLRWLAVHESFAAKYARARDAQADFLAEDIVLISDEECTMIRADKHGTKDEDGEGRTEVVFDPTAVARNRLRVDARKWYAAKLAPKKYGDKITQEHTGADGGPVQTVTRIELVAPEVKG